MRSGASHFLSFTEVIDITAGDQEVLARVARRECGDHLMGCQQAVFAQAHSMAAAFETQVSHSVAGLRALFGALAGTDERTIVVMVSGGLLASDRPGGRPDINDVIDQLSREAALSNASLFALHMDTSFLDAFSPREGMPISRSFLRESGVVAGGLERLAGGVGGTLLAVRAGNGDYAFDRVLRETSAYYLLGVGVEDAERDGQPHYISVDVKARGAEVRSRSTVVIPKER